MAVGRIYYNRPYIQGNEMAYIQEAIQQNFISGQGPFTKKCQDWFDRQLGFERTLLTTSCTDALEMCALLLDLKEGDEVILPSFAFVSVANAFLLHGATLKFADSQSDHPNLSLESVESLINNRTRAIVFIDYAGMGVGVDQMRQLAENHNLVLIEDAAHGLGANYKNKKIGSFGHLSTLSFHESKNITCGEGGALIVNDERYFERACVLLEKGTNRNKFRQGVINKYEWVDKGASYLLSDLNAAMLLGQLENLQFINEKRIEIWNTYRSAFENINEEISLPTLPEFCDHNAHIFYLLMNSEESQKEILNFLNLKSIWATFHYLPLHLSPFFKDQYYGPELKNAVKFSESIVRLPLHLHLAEVDINYIIKWVKNYCED